MSKEKEQSMLNKWSLMERATQVRDPDAVAPVPYDCQDLQECLLWRQTIQQQIGEKVSQIQNSGLEEYKIKLLNDQINNLLETMRLWEKQIRALGGPNFDQAQQANDNILCHNNYYYFGAAKDIPGVKEAIMKKKQCDLQIDINRLQQNLEQKYYDCKIDEELAQQLKQKQKKYQQRKVLDFIELNKNILRLKVDINQGDKILNYIQNNEFQLNIYYSTIKQKFSMLFLV